MKGFFDMDALDITPLTKAKRIKPTVKQEIYTCEGCALYKNCNGKIDYVGKGKQGILIVLEQATTTSDRLQNPLTGETKHIIASLCKGANLSLQDVHVVNSIRCIGKINKATIGACRGLLEQTIQELQPRSIITIGAQALNVLIGDMITVGGTGARSKGDWSLPSYKWEGGAIPYHKGKCTIYPTYGVRDLITSRYNKVMELKMLNQFIAAKKGKEYVDYTNLNIELLTSVSEIKNALLNMETEDVVAFDYETTGLQPFKKGHEIIAMSVATKEKAYGFKVTNAIIPHIKHFLESDVPKVMHNIKYELLWSRHIFGVDVNNVVADTMLVAHSINNAPSIVGLKFQTFLYFGIAGYDDTIAPYLKAKDKSVHSFNQLYYMKQQGELVHILEDLLTYCAYDSLYTIWLYYEQKKQIDAHMQVGVDLFLESAKVFSEIEYKGMRIDENVVADNMRKLTLNLQELEEKINNTKEVRQWNLPTEFNFGSNKDMGVLLYDILGYKAYKKTTGGANSTDKEALEKIIEKEDSEFLKLVLEHKSRTKMRDTYLKGLERDTLNGYIRPSFNLHTVQTFRSCVAKGTSILLAQDMLAYPNGVPIEKVKKGDLIYCYDNELHPVVRKVKWAGKTGHRKVVRVHYSSRATHKSIGYVDVTPEHKIRTINGEYVQAKDLLKIDTRVQGESKYVAKRRVLAGSRVGDKLNFTRHVKNGKGLLEHRFLYKYFYGELLDEHVVHHINHNHLDNRKDNLIALTKEEHGFHHGSSKKGDAVYKRDINGVFYKKDNPTTKTTVSYFIYTKTSCIREIVRARGKVSKTSCDFGTLMHYVDIFNIDVTALQLRYNKKGEYLCRNKVKKAAKQGNTKAQKILSVGYAKLLKLYELYNVTPTKKWANQFGEFAPANHVITDVEYLSDSVDVYDIEVEEFHNFIANEICVHNSSSGPNFQNIPKRDKLAVNMIRTAFVPDEGAFIEELDFSSLEVNISQCYNQDKNLLKYLTNPAHNMHTDSACDIFLRTKETMLKEERNQTKGGFVFAQSYGSSYKNCAKNMWDNMGEASKKHLASKGYNTLDKFTEIVANAENEFWNVRFKRWGQWKRENWNDYQKNGYIDLYTGFRLNALMGSTQASNAAIQGSAFHCLLYVLTFIHTYIKQLELKSRIVGQIHDSIVMNMYEDEAELIHKIVKRALDSLRDEWSWITVQLTLDYEQTPIDGNWSQLEEKGSIRSK